MKPDLFHNHPTGGFGFSPATVGIYIAKLEAAGHPVKGQLSCEDLEALYREATAPPEQREILRRRREEKSK